jgi:hypothetical protein
VSGRDPDQVKIVEYIRTCVDDDEDVARIGLAKAMVGYTMGIRKERGFLAHFGRLGFTSELKKLDEMEANGASKDDVADAFPPDLMLKVGYFGKPEGAASAFRRLSEGLNPAVDIPILRITPARPTVESVEAIMRACAPDRLAAA